MYTFQELKERHREERSLYSEYLTVRVHRALSWLQRAEMCEGDLDGKFIFLWISFNAAYANDLKKEHRIYEQEMFNSFIAKLHDLDESKRLDRLAWDEFSHSIRVLLDNQYVFQPFWDYTSNQLTEVEWLDRFDVAKKSASKALGRGDTPRVLSIVMSRLYALRNQLIHGGATWNSGVNREQMRDCTKLLGKLVPTVIEIMMDNPSELWGQPCYPVVHL